MYSQIEDVHFRSKDIFPFFPNHSTNYSNLAQEGACQWQHMGLSLQCQMSCQSYSWQSFIRFWHVLVYRKKNWQRWSNLTTVIYFLMAQIVASLFLSLLFHSLCHALLFIFICNSSLFIFSSYLSSHLSSME